MEQKSIWKLNGDGSYVNLLPVRNRFTQRRVFPTSQCCVKPHERQFFEAV